MGNQQVSNVLLKGISYTIENKIKKSPIDKTFTGLIKSINDDNTYNVLIQGKIYTNIPSLFNGLKVNETVKIKSPQNQYSQMYIEGKYNMFDLNKIKEIINSISENNDNILQLTNKISELENSNSQLISEIELLKQEIEQLKGGTS